MHVYTGKNKDLQLLVIKKFYEKGHRMAGCVTPEDVLDIISKNTVSFGTYFKDESLCYNTNNEWDPADWGGEVSVTEFLDEEPKVYVDISLPGQAYTVSLTKEQLQKLKELCEL